MRATLPALAFRLEPTPSISPITVPDLFGDLVITQERRFTSNANQFADDLLYYLLLRKQALEFPLTTTDLLSE